MLFLTRHPPICHTGIACEFAYHSAPKPKEQGAYANKELIPITVWVGADELKAGKLTVKDMRGQHDAADVDKNHGVPVPAAQIVEYLQKLLAK